jgi:hypothetical protein
VTSGKNIFFTGSAGGCLLYSKFFTSFSTTPRSLFRYFRHGKIGLITRDNQVTSKEARSFARCRRCYGLDWHGCLQHWGRNFALIRWYRTWDRVG